jgi:hypothetical protein
MMQNANEEEMQNRAAFIESEPQIIPANFEPSKLETNVIEKTEDENINKKYDPVTLSLTE